MNLDKISKNDATRIYTVFNTNLQAYAFRDISKSPIQPSDNSMYFESYDMDTDMTALGEWISQQTTTQIPLYPFFIKMNQIIGGSRDLHLSLSFAKNPKNYHTAEMYTINPTSFYFKDKKIFLNIPSSIASKTPSTFFGTTLMNSLTAKINTEVTQINGVSAIQFITTFAKKYYRLKNENGAVTYFKKAFVLSLYQYVPFEQSDLSFVLTFSDGETISFESKLFDAGQVASNLKGDVADFESVRSALEDVRKRKLDHKNRITNSTKVPHFSPLDIITNEDFKNLNRKTGNLYDYSLSDIISCGKRTIDGSNVNLLVVKSFSPDKINDFLTVTNQCAQLFDTNKDPIVIVLPLNGGGYLICEEILMKTLSPYSQYNRRYIARISESSENVMRNGYAQSLIDPKTGKTRTPISDYVYTEKSMGSWYDEPITDLYGSVEFTHTQDSYMETENAQYQMKNVRSPNEIIVFTDHFCFSACSLFAKHFQEKKAAILATYSGLPQSTYRDVGESPTAVIEDVYINNGNDVTLSSYGLEMGISFLPSLPVDTTSEVPNEYKVHHPDNYVEIESFDETESSITAFLKKGLEIYNLYKTNCKNGTYKLDSKCANTDTEVLGYICNNGVYGNSCEVVGCVDRYVMDKDGKCVLDTTVIENGALRITIIVALALLVFV
ncbi:hypothetical protein EIN_432450 [Entamoeba invadens IP1]|uniref:Tail specific protease domain-containing protein n=1 Tax=Entamoeba invadens IP1 TaxID=370355 RepID=A0A0A1UCY9_ENTIV|nr:hypothetical protein EIN_432450 [Entamoeba invadens IP1]ELP93703.1 hypothetical protein EIN_432450 [Entamoeba invadens IP1]|eukprot:XP_004260474.1 hypothetical protein EIN_432450 [Entamoeba invadens IP1]